MTVVAGGALIYIAGNIVVLIGQIVGVVVLVAIDTTKQVVVIWGGMAINTSIPFALVIARINREILSVVIGKTSWGPTGIERVTQRAFGTETLRGVIGVVGVIKIR